MRRLPCLFTLDIFLPSCNQDVLITIVFIDENVIVYYQEHHCRINSVLFLVSDIKMELIFCVLLSSLRLSLRLLSTKQNQVNS